MARRRRTRYVQGYDGEWWFPKMRHYKMRCCECGLVHVFNFKVVDGRVRMQAFRDNRATAASRRRPQVKS